MVILLFFVQNYNTFSSWLYNNFSLFFFFSSFAVSKIEKKCSNVQNISE